MATEYIPVEDARTYVFDNAFDLLVIEFPHEITVSKTTMEEIERRLAAFVQREVLPLLHDEGIDFPEECVNSFDVRNPIYTYVMFHVK
jgi:hypothetical protein